MTIDQILEELPSLAREELEAIEARILFLKGRSHRIKLITINEEFYTALSSVFKERGITLSSYENFQKTKNFKTYENKMLVVDHFVKDHFDGLDKITRMDLYKKLAMLLCNAVEAYNHGGLCINLVCGNVDKIPEYFDRAYPGYILSKLHRMILA